MAILDSKLEFSDAQSMLKGSQVGNSLASTNAINLGTGYDEWLNTKYNDLGEGGDLWLNVVVATNFTPATASIRIALQTGSSAAVAVATSGNTELGVWTVTGSGNGSTIKAGQYLVRSKLPAGTGANAYAQYLGLLYSDASSSGASVITAGAFNAWIGMDSESQAPSA